MARRRRGDSVALEARERVARARVWLGKAEVLEREDRGR